MKLIALFVPEDKTRANRFKDPRHSVKRVHYSFDRKRGKARDR